MRPFRRWSSANKSQHLWTKSRQFRPLTACGDEGDDRRIDLDAENKLIDGQITLNAEVLQTEIASLTASRQSDV
jgi:hypothetical protein